MKQIIITMTDDDSGVHVGMTDTEIEGGFNSTEALAMLKCARKGFEDELIKSAIVFFESEESEEVTKLKQLLKEANES